jgi:hypothetical protein
VVPTRPVRHLALLGLLCACGQPRDVAKPSAAPPARSFPGFSLAVPAGKVTANVSSYVSGDYQVELADGAVRSVSVRWAAGSIDPDELAVTIEQYKAEGIDATAEHVAGSDGSQIPTVVTRDGADTRWMSVVTCGTRRIFVEMVGREVARHHALVRSFACHADPAREPKPGTIRLALDLPQFFTQPKGRYDGQLLLTDSVAINLILVESPAGSSFAPRQDLFDVKDLVFDEPIRGRIPYAGVFQGEKVRGFIIEKRCTTFHVSIIAYTLVHRASHLATVVEPIENARCLEEGEPPPTWPDAFAR